MARQTSRISLTYLIPSLNKALPGIYMVSMPLLCESGTIDPLTVRSSSYLWLKHWGLPFSSTSKLICGVYLCDWGIKREAEWCTHYIDDHLPYTQFKLRESSNKNHLLIWNSRLMIINSIKSVLKRVCNTQYSSKTSLSGFEVTAEAVVGREYA